MSLYLQSAQNCDFSVFDDLIVFLVKLSCATKFQQIPGMRLDSLFYYSRDSSFFRTFITGNICSVSHLSI